MPNDQLVSYLRQQLIAGVSKEEIRRSAVAARWMPADINAAFAVIEGVGNIEGPVPLVRPVAPPARTLSADVANVSSPGVGASGTFATPSRRSLVPFLAAGATLLVIGGVAFAYFEQIGPFSVTQYVEATFLTDVMAKAAQIKSVSYTASVSLAVNPREKDATTFVVPPADPALDAQYKNDSQRASDLRYIVRGLTGKYGTQRTYDYSKGTYVTKVGKPFPTALSKADLSSFVYGSTGTDPLTGAPYQYAQTEGGKNFALTATFETSAAINQIRSSYNYAATTTPITGQKVTFTKDSDSYFYLPSSAPKPFLAQLADMARTIPPDVSGDVGVAATTDFTAEGLPDWHFSLTANGNLGDLTYAVDVEALRKDKNYYIRVNKMPALFGSLSNYKGQWIVISPTAASSTTGGYDEFSSIASGISSAETDYKKNRADASIALRKLAQLADKDKLFVFKSKPVRETVDGRDLYRYELDMNKDSVVAFYKDVLADPSSYKSFGITQDQGLLDYLQSKDFDDMFAYLKKNAFVTLWTDKNGFPAILEYRLRVVPPDTATQLKGKQIDITFKLTFTDVNQGVNIVAPTGAKPIQTVIDEISNNEGGTLNDARTTSADASVKSDLQYVQTEAEIYHDTNSTYGVQAWATGAAISCTGGIFKDSTIASSLQHADTQNSTGQVTCYAYGTGYLLGADLKSSGWWCVDSKGTSKTETGSLSSVKQMKSCP